MAWLVTRTDLPGAAFLGRGRGAPLVIPSYVAAFCLLGFFGERGLLGMRSASSGCPSSRLLGLPGRTDARNLPVRLPADPVGLAEPRPGARGGGARPRCLRPTHAAPRDGAGHSLGRRSRRAPRRPVHALRLRSRLAMDYDTLTRAIYVQYRSLFDRAPAAIWRSPRGPDRVALAIEYRARQSGRAVYERVRAQRQQPSSAPRRAGRFPRSCSAARCRLLPRAARRSARLLACPRNRERPHARRPVEPGAPLLDGLRPGRSRRGRRRVSCRAFSRSGTRHEPRALLERFVRGQCSSGARHRPIAGVLRRPLRVPVYQTLGLLVFAYVVRSSPGPLGCRIGARARQSRIRRGCAGPRAWTASDNRRRDRCRSSARASSRAPPWSSCPR